MQFTKFITKKNKVEDDLVTLNKLSPYNSILKWIQAEQVQVIYVVMWTKIKFTII